MTTLSEVAVRPSGWESSPESERFPVSLLGHVMPKIYVLVSEVFALPAGADTGAIIKSMTTGLKVALASFPVLCGCLEMDATTGQMWVTKKRESAAALHLKYMPGGEFPSYAELEQKDFPASLLAAHQILPSAVTAKQLHSPLGDNNDEGISIAAFQLNFIKDGLIVGVAIHHSVSDGPGCDGFLTTWAENSALALCGLPSVVKDVTFDLLNSPLNTAKPLPKQIAKIKDAYPVLKNSGGPMQPPPPGFVLPNLVPQMWHFPKSKTEALKTKASSTDGSWISTYDAVMAMVWSSATRARMDLFKPAPESTTLLVHAVDTRSTWSPPLSPSFLGVGTAPASCKPLSIQDIIDPANLPLVAASVRSSIKQITPDYLTGLLEWIAGQDDRRYLEISLNSFLGMDFGGSSWQSMRAYETHNFGFGFPSALRWPCPMFDGFVFVYPSRANTKAAAADEGIEVCICLEEGCHQRLMADSVLLEYAQPRGV
ncbi:transferase family-domain-containing protein [Limtongia smithiae]|uniref:transferase family-domain-containing protein n=1 Tax=Limtongia smithiae TaxID=1125753 RepID=UPI0034CF7FDB